MSKLTSWFKKTKERLKTWVQKKLVSDWKDCLKWSSMHAFAVIGFINLAWLEVPAQWRESVPPEWLAKGAIVLTVVGVVARLSNQGDDGGGDAE